VGGCGVGTAFFFFSSLFGGFFVFGGGGVVGCSVGGVGVSGFLGGFFVGVWGFCFWFGLATLFFFSFPQVLRLLHPPAVFLTTTICFFDFFFFFPYPTIPMFKRVPFLNPSPPSQRVRLASEVFSVFLISQRTNFFPCSFPLTPISWTADSVPISFS